MGGPTDDAVGGGHERLNGEHRRLKVLVLAEAANPEWSSVPLVGWRMFQAIDSIADAHLVTQVRNADAIKRSGLPESKYTLIDSEAVTRPVYKFSKLLRGSKGQGWTLATALSSLSYPYYEHLVWRRFGRALKAREFDVVHRVTPVSPAIGSRIAGPCSRAGVPFVLGPINGGVPWPKEFRGVQRKEREFLSSLRSLHRAAPSYRATRKHAAAILCGSSTAWNEVPAAYRAKAIYLPENAVESTWLSAAPERPAPKPLRVTFVGRLVALKGVDMLVEAAGPLLKEGDVTLDIVGDGPERAALEALVRSLGVENQVRFRGWLQHEEVAKQLAQAHVLGFPSIREFGGGVVLEAMAMGAVPLVLAYGGPAELIAPECGIGVPMGARQDIIAGFRTELQQLANRPDLLATMARAARERVLEYFTWHAKARQLEAVYDWVVHRRSEKPTFGMPLGVSTRALATSNESD